MAGEISRSVFDQTEVYYILRSTRRSNFDESEVRRGTPGTGPWNVVGEELGRFSLRYVQASFIGKSAEVFWAKCLLAGPLSGGFSFTVG